MSNDPLQGLASVLTPEVYQQFEPILTALAQRIADNESTISEVRQETASAERITAAFREALRGATIPVPSTSTSSGRATSFRIDLPYFRGTVNENLRAWLSIVEDQLKASGVNRDNWAVTISGLFRDAAQTWYLSRKMANGGQPLAIDDLIQELKLQFDSATRLDDIRQHLARATYRNNVTSFIDHFQRLEMQLDDSEMAFGDRKFHFLRPLPPDLCFHISSTKPRTMADVYEAARDWERHKRVANHASTRSTHHSSPAHHSTSRSTPAPTHLPNSYSAATTASASSPAPAPMDLDNFEVRRRQQHGNDRDRDRRPIDMTGIRCFNCNRAGHWAKDCRLPDRRRTPATGANRASSARPGGPRHSMFHFGDPQPIRPRDVAAPYPRTSPIKLQLHFLNLDDETSEGLPVYHATVKGRNKKKDGRTTIPLLVETIIDTAAADSYISRAVAEGSNSEIFPLDQPREVSGAGHTQTKAFAKFLLQIGNIKEITLAYLLEDDSGFRYDLLLGRNWMKRYNVIPRWEDNSFSLTSPKTHTTVRIQDLHALDTVFDDDEWDNRSLPSENYSVSDGSEDSMPDLVDMSDSDDDDSSNSEKDISTRPSAQPASAPTPTSVPSVDDTPKLSKWSTFGVSLREKVTKKFPKLFRKDPVRIRGRPYSPVENEAIKSFVDEGLKEGIIEESESPWSSPLLLVPKKDDECYVNLKDADIFTTLDLKRGYWQGIQAHEKDVEKDEILYLGHYVSGDGIQVNPDKVKAILEWPVPSTITGVASPMYDLLQGSPKKGSSIIWTEPAQHAFDALKRALTNTRNCIGAVLQQCLTPFDDSNEGGEVSADDKYHFKDKDLRPIAYESRRMTPTEQRYSAQEREMLAIVHSLKKWRGYIEGSPIVIVYRPGRSQVAADALSRREGHDEVPDTEYEPLYAYAAELDPADHAEIFKTLEGYREKLLKGAVIENGAYMYVVVPTSLKNALELVKALHVDLGHLGINAVQSALRDRAWMPFVSQIVEHVPLHPLPRVDACDLWAFDFIGPLPKTKKVLTDNGEEFMSYHFQNTNGRLEKFNDTLVQMLARFSAPDRQDQWDEYLNDALLAHRAHTNNSLGTSPAYMMYGRNPRLPNESLQHARLEHIKKLERYREEANAKALARLEAEADKRDETMTERGIGIGDLVLRRNERQTKLHPRWDEMATSFATSTTALASGSTTRPSTPELLLRCPTPRFGMHPEIFSDATHNIV